MKKVAVLGCTGSIGSQTLDVVRHNGDKLKVVSIVAFSNAQKLSTCVEEFKPGFSALISESGVDCLIDAVKNADIAVVATKGITALKCVEYCLKNGIDVALANKEVLVTAGSIVMPMQSKARIIPIDSEHCAISECLHGRNSNDIKKIFLTASGGPFYSLESFDNICAKDALKHPNWSMGDKITIDSSTMVNKAFEVIEASHLFGVPTDKIEIVVHRQSVVHSMVEFQNGSVMAQLAKPDMRLPIQIALLGNEYPFERLSFDKMLDLTFEKCNYERFPCAKLGHELSERYAYAPTVFNSANDVLVDAFLKGSFSYSDFYVTICDVVNKFENEYSNIVLTIDGIIACDKVVKQYVSELVFNKHD